MNYFYDLLVNPQEEFLEFYEWEKKDTIVPVKKVPVFKVSEQVIFDFLKRNITLSLELTMKIKDKTIIKNTKEKISGLLLTDGKTSLFIEFDDLGQVIYRSKLLVEDENNINEVSYSMKEEEITYQIGEALPIRKELRKTKEEKKRIKAELRKLKTNKNIAKCSYLYFEWFHDFEKDYNKSIEKMSNELKWAKASDVHRLFHLINLSYKEKL